MNGRKKPPRSFGDWLRQRREALDLTYEELARQVACSAVTLRKLEAEERRPSKQMAERLSAVLQVTVADRPAFVRFARGDPFAAPPETGPFLARAPLALAGRPRHNLPLQLTGFYGREDDIAHVRGTLADRRLVTLTGSGGVGKTRLALRIAEEMLTDFPGGAWLVELAPIAEPAAGMKPRSTCQRAARHSAQAHGGRARYWAPVCSRAPVRRGMIRGPASLDWSRPWPFIASWATTSVWRTRCFG